MSVLYPVIVDGFRLFVNPTKMEVQKRSQISEVRTMAGTSFQVWPDLPDTVSFEGTSYGIRSISELRGLADAIEKSPSDKEIELVYKNTKYIGYVREFNVTADADSPRQYKYKFTFTVKKPRFKVDSMPIGQTPGLKVEFDFFAAQLRQTSSEISSMPFDIKNNASAIYAQISGTSGAQQKGLGTFIGRPKGGVFG